MWEMQNAGVRVVKFVLVLGLLIVSLGTPKFGEWQTSDTSKPVASGTIRGTPKFGERQTSDTSKPVASGTTLGVIGGFEDLYLRDWTQIIISGIFRSSINYLRYWELYLDDQMVYNDSWPPGTLGGPEYPDELEETDLFTPSVSDGNHLMRVVVGDWAGNVNDSYTFILTMSTTFKPQSTDLGDYCPFEELEGEARLKGTIRSIGNMTNWILSVGPITAEGVIPPETHASEMYYFEYNLSSLRYGVYTYNLTVFCVQGQIWNYFINTINITYNPVVHVPIHSNLLPTYTFYAGTSEAKIEGSCTDPDGSLQGIHCWANNSLLYNLSFTAGIATHNFTVPLSSLAVGEYLFNLTSWDNESLTTTSLGTVQLILPPTAEYDFSIFLLLGMFSIPLFGLLIDGWFLQKKVNTSKKK